MNNGLKNNIVNLSRRVKIIMFPGISVGGADKIRLKLEKTKAARKIAVRIISKFIFIWIEKNKIPKIRGIKVKINPNKNELNILPNNIVFMETGQVIKRSNVFRIVSQGKTNGPIDVAVKKRTIAISPEIKRGVGIFLPIVNVKKRIIGKIIP